MIKEFLALLGILAASAIGYYSYTLSQIKTEPVSPTPVVKSPVKPAPVVVFPEEGIVKNPLIHIDTPPAPAQPVEPTPPPVIETPVEPIPPVVTPPPVTEKSVEPPPVVDKSGSNEPLPPIMFAYPPIIDKSDDPIWKPKKTTPQIKPCAPCPCKLKKKTKMKFQMPQWMEEIKPHAAPSPSKKSSVKPKIINPSVSP